MENHKQYSPLIQVASSKRFPETDTRKYWDGVFTSTSTDTDYRHIPESEFQNIINGFTAGLRILDSHKHQTQGMGKTTHAERQGNEIHGSFYILKDLKLEGQSYPNTTEWIKAIDDGLADKLSMGWYAERKICDISGESIYSYKCPYWPGERYMVTDPETGEEEMRTATYTCYGITPVELSLVYFPANPDARLIAKAKALAENNLLNPDQIARIESELNTAIIDTERSYFEMPLSPEDKKEIAAIVREVNKETAGDPPVATAAPASPAGPSAETQAGLYVVRNDKGEIVRTLTADELPAKPEPATVADVAAAIKPLTDKIVGIEQTLATGESNVDKAKAVEANLQQYIRMYGKDADVEPHKAFLETLPDIAAIEANTLEYKNFADEKFGSEGSRTPSVLDQFDKKQTEGETDEPPNPQSQ